MSRVKIEKKITDVKMDKMNIMDIIGEVDSKLVCAWIEPENLDGVLHINEDGLYTRDEMYWSENAEVIFTHESIHETICILFPNSKQEHVWLDDPRRFGSISRSNFLMDCDTKWLIGKWEWKKGKWIKKRFL